MGDDQNAPVVVPRPTLGSGCRHSRASSLRPRGRWTQPACFVWASRAGVVGAAGALRESESTKSMPRVSGAGLNLLQKCSQIPFYVRKHRI